MKSSAIILQFLALIKENGFTLKKARTTWYSTETVIEADCADDLMLLTNTCPSQIPTA